MEDVDRMLAEAERIVLPIARRMSGNWMSADDLAQELRIETLDLAEKVLAIVAKTPMKPGDLAKRLGTAPVAIGTCVKACEKLTKVDGLVTVA